MQKMLFWIWKKAAFVTMALTCLSPVLARYAELEPPSLLGWAAWSDGGRLADVVEQGCGVPFWRIFLYVPECCRFLALSFRLICFDARGDFVWGRYAILLCNEITSIASLTKSRSLSPRKAFWVPAVHFYGSWCGNKLRAAQRKGNRKQQYSKHPAWLGSGMSCFVSEIYGDK